MSCKDFEENVTLSQYDELSEEKRAALDAHLANCTACRARLEQAKRINALLATRPSSEPSPELLAQCRTALDEAIDRELASVSWKKLFGELWSGLISVPLTRASWALAILLFGIGLGWTLRPHAKPVPATGGAANPPTESSSLTPDMSNLRINAITQVTPTPEKGQVRITVDAERRMTLEGSLDDPRIRQVLVDAVKSYSNPGIRRDSLDALREAGGDLPSVREALLYALQNDPNPGVRLEALRTVRKMDWTPEVQKAMMNALAPDNNPGVRVAAIDVLVQHAGQSNLPVLERLASDDSNPYVRMKSLNAVHRLEAAMYSGESR
jgi:HEAT repeats/Putative zinc-finger